MFRHLRIHARFVLLQMQRRLSFTSRWKNLQINKNYKDASHNDFNNYNQQVFDNEAPEENDRSEKDHQKHVSDEPVEEAYHRDEDENDQSRVERRQRSQLSLSSWLSLQRRRRILSRYIIPFSLLFLLLIFRCRESYAFTRSSDTTNELKFYRTLRCCLARGRFHPQKGTEITRDCRDLEYLLRVKPNGAFKTNFAKKLNRPSAHIQS